MTKAQREILDAIKETLDIHEDQIASDDAVLICYHFRDENGKDKVGGMVAGNNMSLIALVGTVMNQSERIERVMKEGVEAYDNLQSLKEFDKPKDGESLQDYMERMAKEQGMNIPEEIKRFFKVIEADIEKEQDPIDRIKKALRWRDIMDSMK